MHIYMCMCVFIYIYIYIYHSLHIYLCVFTIYLSIKKIKTYFVLYDRKTSPLYIYFFYGI